MNKMKIKPNILIVDDIPENLHLLIELLNDKNYLVRPVTSGKLALSAAQIMPPDLILLDINMPVMDGFETCELLKKQAITADIPVIFLTARTDVFDKVKGFDVGGVDYITKPYKIPEILARINTHLTIHCLKKKLEEKNKQLNNKTLIINQHIMYSTTDKKGFIQSVSQYFCQVTGYNEDELIDKKHNILRHPDTLLAVYEDLWATILNKEVWKGELKAVYKNGSEHWLQHIITPLFGQKNKLEGFAAISHDITDKKIIEKMAITDYLTGLYNRHKLEQILNHEIERFNRYGGHFSVIIIDIDFFKKINDHYGHPVGDETLIYLANIMKNNSRETDYISRWGGEEFLIVCCETTAVEASVLANQLRVVIEKTHFPIIEKLTISSGVAEHMSEETVSTLISKADQALYKAKLTGRNKVVVYKEMIQ